MFRPSSPSVNQIVIIIWNKIQQIHSGIKWMPPPEAVDAFSRASMDGQLRDHNGNMIWDWVLF